MLRGMHAMFYSSHDLTAKGAEFTQAVEDHGYGLVTNLNVPGGFRVQLHQPSYTK